MKFLITIPITLVWLSCFSQTGSIEGYINNRYENKPFPFVMIVITDTVIGSISDSTGHFKINGVPVGVYNLNLSHVGYEKKIINNIRVIRDSATYLLIDYPPPCKYDKSKISDSCPICGKQDKVIPIMYGFPSNGSIKQGRRAKILLGGCEVSGCDPNKYCKRDKVKF